MKQSSRPQVILGLMIFGISAIGATAPSPSPPPSRSICAASDAPLKTMLSAIADASPKTIALTKAALALQAGSPISQFRELEKSQARAVDAAEPGFLAFGTIGMSMSNFPPGPQRTLIGDEALALSHTLHHIEDQDELILAYERDVQSEREVVVSSDASGPRSARAEATALGFNGVAELSIQRKLAPKLQHERTALQSGMASMMDPSADQKAVDAAANICTLPPEIQSTQKPAP